MSVKLICRQITLQHGWHVYFCLVFYTIVIYACTCTSVLSKYTFTSPSLVSFAFTVTWWWGSWPLSSTSPGPSRWKLKTSLLSQQPQEQCVYSDLLLDIYVLRYCMGPRGLAVSLGIVCVDNSLTSIKSCLTTPFFSTRDGPNNIYPQ